MARNYNNPAGGTQSGITGTKQNGTAGTQFQQFYYQKQALIEARKAQFFTQLADVVSMPKNFGKTIKRYHYMPLLDDRNINDQGLDAAGATIANGNLYGSSRDVGTITSKLPTLSENGGRVNRVGFKRKELEGSISKFGFFDEYTQESIDFDTDAELMQHINREMINGAVQLTEAALQVDLLNSAGVVRYTGPATSKATINSACVVTYNDLLRLHMDLYRNRTPEHTTMITGTRMIDTKVIPSARVMYCGSDLLPTLQSMKDLHGERAFIPVEKYAAGTDKLEGEAGAIDRFRIVLVPEMLRWEAAGATTAADPEASKFHTSGNKYTVFPMLCVGDQSFTTIGFQTDGKSVKFKITHKAPGEAMATTQDPYGESGFMSIKWYYGFMALRPERIGLILTAAKL